MDYLRLWRAGQNAFGLENVALGRTSVNAVRPRPLQKRKGQKEKFWQGTCCFLEKLWPSKMMMIATLGNNLISVFHFSIGIMKNHENKMSPHRLRLAPISVTKKLQSPGVLCVDTGRAQTSGKFKTPYLWERVL